MLVKRSLAALGAGALSLGAIVPLAGTAVADAHVQDLQAACEGLTEPFGFKDIQSLHEATQDAINCLAHYGITEGRSATTYAPRDEVKRYEMAIFLTRVLAYIDEYDTIGLEITPDWSDAGFDDLEGVPEDGVDAINFIANLGVAKGKTPNLYDPYAPVTRRDMASFINRVQDVIASEAPEADYDPADATKEFDDVPPTMPRAEDIYALEGAGIVQGTSAKTYKPFASVLRSEMAFYIMRHLNENMAAGRVESQADTGEEPPADTTDPTVKATAPAVGDKTVVFTANEDLDDASVQTTDFSTSVSAGVTGAVENDGVITVTLGAPLAAADTVTLAANSVQDLAGNEGPAAAVTGKAPAAPPPTDTTDPTVQADTLIAGSTTATFTASEPLAEGTVAIDDFEEDSARSITGVTVEGATITVTFNSFLGEGDTVTLLAGSVADLAGNTGPEEDETATAALNEAGLPRPGADIGSLVVGQPSVDVTFTEDVVGSRLDPDDFGIRTVAGTTRSLTASDITFEFALNDETGEDVATVTFSDDFAASLAAGDVLFLEANAVYDQDGNRGPDQPVEETVQAGTA